MFSRVLLLTILLIAGCTPVEKVKSVITTPNIVLIMTDDQGWGDLSIHGNTNLHTPQLDAIAAKGASFTNFYVQPVCSPTRAEMLTGRYARRLGVYSTSSGGERMNLGEQTVAEIFREAGYATAAFGKWHNGSQPPYHPNARGFDEFYGFTSGHWGSYFSPMLEHNGEIVKGTGFLPDDLTNAAIEFIEGQESNPFFVFLSFNTPHSPMQVPDSYWERMNGKPLVQRYRDSTLEDTLFTKAALAMVENIDDNVGRIRELLNRRKLIEKTILVFLSDNGPNSYRWNNGMAGRKGSTDEGGVRVPFFIQWEGTIPSGKQIPQIAGAIDVLPTLTSLAGIDQDPPKPLDGKDLSPLLLEAALEEWDDRLLFQHWNGSTSVRAQNFRLANNNNLYHIVEDRGQESDIATQFPVMADSLLKAKRQWLENTTGLTANTDTRLLPIGHEEFRYTHLPARDGSGSGTIVRSNQYPNCSYFTNWTRVEDYISWEVEVLDEGPFEVILYYTCAPQNVGAVLELQLGEAIISREITEAHNPPLAGMENDRYPRMESYIKDFKPLSLGRIEAEKGTATLKLKALGKKGPGIVDVRLLVFEKVL